MLFSLHQFHCTCGKFLTFSSHWNLLPRATCYISSHSLMWGKGFLTFPQPIFNFLTFWMCGIGCNEFPHTFPHTRPSRKIKRKIPYIFPMCGTLFSLHQFHTCGKFLTFSSLFPHIFLTLKFHSDSWRVCVCVGVKSLSYTCKRILQLQFPKEIILTLSITSATVASMPLWFLRLTSSSLTRCSNCLLPAGPSFLARRSSRETSLQRSKSWPKIKIRQRMHVRNDENICLVMHA